MKRRMLPNNAIEVMIASLSKNSIKQYDTCLRQWWQFCTSSKEDFLSASVPKILTYLMTIFEKGASYQTLNCHRSALSLVMGNSIGADDRIKRWFKGVFKLRPNVPKYTSTWDPAIVLSYIRHWYPLDTLDLRRMTLRTAILLALTTGQRIQTLHSIKTHNIKITEEGVEIALTDIQKTSTPSNFMSKLTLPSLKNDPEVCPVNSLLHYLEVTKDHRKHNSDLQLFLTFKRPYKPATTQSISRWLKVVMKESGINVSIFSSHSTRHASSSRAYRAGLTVDSILKAVGWSNRSLTFARYYNRPLSINEQTEFARAVCNSENA